MLCSGLLLVLILVFHQIHSHILYRICRSVGQTYGNEPQLVSGVHEACSYTLPLVWAVPCRLTSPLQQLPWRPEGWGPLCGRGSLAC